MKRKIAYLLAAAFVLLLLTACGDQPEEESSKNESSVQDSSVTESSADTPEDEKTVLGDLLMSTFADLWTSPTYYIDVTMSVDSTLQVTENTENSSMVYSYVIAVDSDQELAALDISWSDGTHGHLIVNKNKCYNIDDEKKTYAVSDYPHDARYLGEMYTTDIYLGMINFITLESSGKTAYKEQDGSTVNVDYERYRITDIPESSTNTDDITITYYFKDNKPYAEIMSSGRGETVCRFNTVTNTIKDNGIFKVPDDYKKVDSET